MNRHIPRKKIQITGENGYSLLESATSLLILSIAFATVVPVWSTVQSQERLAAKMIRASQLASDEMEKAAAGMFQPGNRTVTESGEKFHIHSQHLPDKDGAHVWVAVTFQERGKDHEIIYESVVPFVQAQ